MITRAIATISVLLLLTLGQPVFASGEHPWQPQQPQSKQTSQTATDSENSTQSLIVSDAEIFAVVRKYIYTYAQKLTDKKFHVQSGGKDVALDLVAIHDDRRSHLGGNKYFVCVDMKAANGAIYDIDFFLKIHPGVLSGTGTSVHKINGKPLYNWKQQGGVWKKVPVS